MEICKFCCNFAAAKLNFYIMNYDEIKNKLREIVDTPAAALTPEQKAAVREYAKAYWVEFKPKARCASCYHDAAMAIWERVKEAEAKESAPEDTRKYILKPGVDLFFGSIRVNEVTLTDDLAEQILARGFNHKYFIKCE